MTNTTTYNDILRIIENPKKLLGHFLLENLDEENFACPEDNEIEIRVYVGDNLITKPHDLNTVLTDWVHRWVKQYLEDNYNFSNFRKSVEDEARKISKEKSSRFYEDMAELKEKMEEKLRQTFLDIECLDPDLYTSNKKKDERIAELEREVAHLKAKAGEPIGFGKDPLAQARCNYDSW